MKKALTILMLLSLLISIAVMPTQAAGDDLWVPVRSSSVAETEQYPSLPTYQFTGNGLQVTYPTYPEEQKDRGFGSGVVYNKKVNIDGFSVKLKFDNYNIPDGYEVWLGVAFSDSVDLPFWGSKALGGHIQLFPNKDDTLTVRSYINKDNKQTNTNVTVPRTDINPRNAEIEISFTKVTGGYKVMINGMEYGQNFADYTTMFTDGKAYPVFAFYSKRCDNQDMKFTVLSINGEKPVAQSSGTTTTTTTSPVTSDFFSAYLLAAIILPAISLVIVKTRKHRTLI